MYHSFQSQPLMFLPSRQHKTRGSVRECQIRWTRRTLVVRRQYWSQCERRAAGLALCLMYLFQSGTGTGIGSTLLGPSETRDRWSERLHCPTSPQCLPASLTLQMFPDAQRCFGQSGQPGCSPPPLTPPFWLFQTRARTTPGWSATPAYTCHKT